MEEPTKHPQFVDVLGADCSDRWSGQLKLFTSEQCVGTVVLLIGRVAWAVCVDQPEDLGTFLVRLGRVAPDELREVRTRYEALGGRRKLGALLEEAGILSRPVLRRCLQLHTQRAISRMASYQGARVVRELVDLRVSDEELTFALEDIMPDSMAATSKLNGTRRSAWPSWSEWSHHNKVLADLRSIPAYRGAAIYSSEGELLTAHVTDAGIDPLVIGVFVASVMEASSRAAISGESGAVGCVHLECTHGALVARWLDDCRSRMVVVLVGEGGNTGMAKYRIGAMQDALVGWTRA